ncbi:MULTISPECIES: hypothetical protein [Xanthomonas]|uniref:hypothetical protein n=1 Tax=Xanthomonas TaxID=338 RepID=UPI0012FF1DED|nr:MULTISPECIES: hypothetical protein [Xanthomonas]MDY4296024.1 hypothetical protein [Xanthomonas sp. LF02-5]
MNPQSRAHRILRPLENFVTSREACSIPEEFRDVSLGEFIGLYRNRAEHVGDVAFFSEGMAWRESTEVLQVKYGEILYHSLPNEKKSLSLLVRLSSGREVLMPVTGVKDGKFFDALAVTRFLYRVVEDLQRRR